MNRSTFWMIKYMNGSVFSKARYMNGVSFEILARTPVPKLTMLRPPPPSNPRGSFTESSRNVDYIDISVKVPFLAVRLRLLFWIFTASIQCMARKHHFSLSN